uniref:uncharacterized protein n=1 Tax=Myxine glutinosa TaxID=7769 RepID=UPI00358FA92E
MALVQEEKTPEKEALHSLPVAVGCTIAGSAPMSLMHCPLFQRNVSPAQVEVLSPRLDVKGEQVHQFTVKNKVLSENLENVSSKLPEVQLQLQKQRQWHEEEQQKNVQSFHQAEALSQRSSVNDDQINEIAVKNNIFLENLKNVSSKLSEVQLQLQKERQCHEEEQQKNVESFQKVKVLSQQLKSKEYQLDEMTSRFEALLMDHSHLESKYSDLEKQLQEQREKQEHHDVEYRQQVMQLKTDFQSKDSCWEEVVLKNNETVKAMAEMYRRLGECEQRQQIPQHTPLSRLPVEKEKPQKDAIGQFRSLLNKITPENFDRLINQI